MKKCNYLHEMKVALVLVPKSQADHSQRGREHQSRLHHFPVFFNLNSHHSCHRVGDLVKAQATPEARPAHLKLFKGLLYRNAGPAVGFVVSAKTKATKIRFQLARQRRATAECPVTLPLYPTAAKRTSTRTPVGPVWQINPLPAPFHSSTCDAMLVM